MAYTKISNLVSLGSGTGGGHSPYFHPEDIALLFEVSTDIVATRLMRAVYKKNNLEKQIFVLVGITDLQPINEPPLYQDASAIAVLPCPPLDDPAGIQLDDNGVRIP